MKPTLENTAHIDSLHRAYNRNDIDYVRPAVIGYITDFKKGDIISVLAGHPHKQFAIIQLTTDEVDIDNLCNCTTGASSGSITNLQANSYQWSLMEHR
jgi:hypothetical protein